jgi:hypothetical protein
MNGCKNRELALMKYEEGLLEGAARAEVEAHVAECRTCQQWLEEYGRLKQMLQSEELPERDGEYWAAFQRSIWARVRERGLLPRGDMGRSRGITADQGRFFKRYGAAAAGVLVLFMLVVGLARIGLFTMKGPTDKVPGVMTDGEIELSLIMGMENGTEMSQDRERLLDEFFYSKMEETLVERLQAIDEQTDFFSTLQQLPTNGTKAEEEFYRELFDIPANQNSWQKT